MSKLLYLKQFSIVQVHCLVLFNPWTGTYQALPLRAIGDLGAMAKKLSQAPALLETHHLIA